MRVYLSGSITSSKAYKIEFAKAEQQILEKFPWCTTFNPLSINAESYQEYMRADISKLLDCDFIYFVNDIASSKGAFIEKIIAETCGIKEIKL